MISIKNELFHTNDKSVGTNYFLDFAISYKVKQWELSLTANNLIGTSEFERRTLGNTIESYSVTRYGQGNFSLNGVWICKLKRYSNTVEVI